MTRLFPYSFHHLIIFVWNILRICSFNKYFKIAQNNAETNQDTMASSHVLLQLVV